MTASAGQRPRAYRHVVVGVDGSANSERAARAACALSGAIGATCWLFRADLGVDDVAPEVVDEVRALAARLGASWATAPLGEAPGHPAKLLGVFVDRLGDAVAALGSHGRGAVGAALLGSTTDDYLARGNRPAVVCGPSASVGGPPARVALCTDGSALSVSLLDEAVRWASSLEVPLVVVSSVSDSPAAIDDEVDAQRLVDALAAQAAATGVRARGLVAEGHHPTGALLEELDRLPTLAVLGTHGRSAFVATTLGGVAGAVVREARQLVVLQRHAANPPDATARAPEATAAGQAGEERRG